MKITITIVILTKETFDMEIHDDVTVLDLKNKIKEIKNKEINNIRIICNDNVLENNYYLNKYNIKNGSRLVVMLQQPIDIVMPPIYKYKIPNK